MNSLQSPESAAVSVAALPHDEVRPAAIWKVALPLAAGVFFTMLPVTMLVPVLKEIVSDRFAASTFWTHSFMSVNLVGAVIAAPLSGLLSDRIGRRRPLLLGALALDALLMWSMGRAGGLAELLVLRAAEGAAHIVALTALMALACDWAPARGRGRMMGLVGGCIMLGTSIGAPLGGVIGRTAPQWVFVAGAMASALALLLAAATIPECTRPSAPRGMKQTRELLKHQRLLAVPYLYAFIDRFCVGVIISTFMLYLSHVLQLPPAPRGMLVAYFMIPFAVLSYPVGRWIDRYGRIAPLVGGSMLFGVALALYGWTPLGWLPALMVTSGVLSAIMFAPSLALCADLAPAEQRGTAIAGFNTFGSLGFLCGPLLAGAACALFLPRMGELAGYRWVLMLAGGTEVLCAALTLPVLLKLKRAAKIW